MLDLGSCIFPFTLSQVGVGKSILQTLLGFFMFGGVTFHPVNVVGHVMNIMGGIGYTSWPMCGDSYFEIMYS